MQFRVALTAANPPDNQEEPILVGSRCGLSRRDYLIEGQLFFASAEDFLAAFDFSEPITAINIDVSKAHIWDLSGVNAIDIAVLKFRKAGVAVEVIGLNDASATIMDKLAMHDQPNAIAKVLGH